MADNHVDDCWNKIGVQGNGDRSCVDLDEFVHCRNCNKFISAGRDLLDRAVPENYEKEWCAQLSSAPERQKKQQPVVAFRLSDQWFGLAPKHFHEVVEWSDCHPLPHNKSSELKGIVAVRGELQICLSLEHLLDIKRNVGGGQITDADSCKRMIIILCQGEKYVFPVDEIRDIFHYSSQDLSAPPATISDAKLKRVVYGVLKMDNKYISCLDFNILVDLINGVFE